MAFTLYGKVQVDNHGMYRALKGMQATVGPVGKQIGQQLRRAILSTFSAGAGIAIVKRTLQNAFDIRKEAAGLGIASDTFQTLQTLADQTGASVQDMVDKMTSGTAEGDAFSEAVKKMNAQLLEQGRIIDSGTVDKLADAFQKISELTGRIAPGIAWIADGLTKLYDLGSRAVEHVVGSVQSAYGRYRGDQDMIQAGNELRDQAFSQSTQTDAVSTPETQARVLASAIAAENRKEKAKSGTGSSSGEMKFNDPGSSLATGRYFSASPVKSRSETNLELINRTLSDINSKISSFK